MNVSIVLVERLLTVEKFIVVAVETDIGGYLDGSRLPLVGQSMKLRE